jgi:hypothetical protein
MLPVGGRISVLFLCHGPIVPRSEVEDPALYGSYVRRTVQQVNSVVGECCWASSSKPGGMYSRCYPHLPPPTVWGARAWKCRKSGRPVHLIWGATCDDGMWLIASDLHNSLNSCEVNCVPLSLTIITGTPSWRIVQEVLPLSVGMSCWTLKLHRRTLVRR